MFYLGFDDFPHSGTLALVDGQTSAGTPDLQPHVLPLLHCLVALCLLLHDALPDQPVLWFEPLPDQPVLWFELHHRVLIVIDVAKARALPSAALGLEAEHLESPLYTPDMSSDSSDLGTFARPGWITSTIICFLDRSGFRLNLSVLMITASLMVNGFVVGRATSCERDDENNNYEKM
jgi:hypothetical protein